LFAPQTNYRFVPITVKKVIDTDIQSRSELKPREQGKAFGAFAFVDMKHKTIKATTQLGTKSQAISFALVAPCMH